MTEEKLMTVEEVAELLGITEAGVYGLVFKKKIPAIKISKRLLRFSRSQIQAWLESKAQQPTGQSTPAPTLKRRGRNRKISNAAEGYVNKLVESAKKEVLNV